MENFYAKKLLVKIFDRGQQIYQSPNIHEIKKYCEEQVDLLWREVKRFNNPHEYFVDLSPELWEIKDRLLKENQ